MTNPEYRAFDQGYAAHRAGTTPHANPYALWAAAPGPKLADLWNQGWNARDTDQREKRANP